MKEVKLKLKKWCETENVTVTLSSKGVNYGAVGVPNIVWPWSTVTDWVKKGTVTSATVAFVAIGRKRGWVK